ncbi:hypothetical protein [Streptomyces fractus]|uniref:hypothetical protein n=1 Tax=Streptomyces fractus TaxID=641806 RepID=UPI003CEC51BB
MLPVPLGVIEFFRRHGYDVVHINTETVTTVVDVATPEPKPATRRTGKHGATTNET